MSEITRSTWRSPTISFELPEHRVFAEIALDEVTSAIGSIGSRSSAMIVPSMPPSRSASRCEPCASLLRAYWLQLPGVEPRSTITWPGRISLSCSSISFSL